MFVCPIIVSIYSFAIMDVVILVYMKIDNKKTIENLKILTVNLMFANNKLFKLSLS